jgi:ABC-type arginine/histidine transport system permease subunit
MHLRKGYNFDIIALSFIITTYKGDLLNGTTKKTE